MKIKVIKENFITYYKVVFNIFLCTVSWKLCQSIYPNNISQPSFKPAHQVFDNLPLDNYRTSPNLLSKCPTSLVPWSNLIARS